MDGRQFMTGHYDGSLSTWNIKNAKKPEDRRQPHGKLFHYISKLLKSSSRFFLVS